jgi:branched-chain amino acid transport system ATP-binding protein
MLLRVTDLTKKFDALTAVDAVSFDVEDQEIRSIIGPNGAGKTTLLNLLMGTYDATSGSITIEGTDITDEPDYKRPKYGISKSYQVTNIFPDMNVFENVQTAVGIHSARVFDMVRSLGKNDTVTEQTEALLERMNLDAKRNVEASSLSHGHKRHLEIAMALASEPKLLLLDEPTAGMGPTEATETMDLILKLSKEMGIILVEHNIEHVLSVSDAITVLQQGSVIADGDPKTVENNKRVQEAYLGEQYA